MNRLILAFLLSLAGTAALAEQMPLASGQQLKNAITDNTVQGSMDGSGRYTEFYAKDGTVRSKDYKAKWSIEGDQMCWVYEGQPKDCWRASIKGNNIKWVKDGKAQGDGTIVKGNTNRY